MIDGQHHAADRSDDQTHRPQLSVVVVESAPGPLRPAFFDALASGLEIGTLEVVVVTSSAAARSEPRPGVRRVECPTGTTIPRMRAMGWGAARAPLAALTESFCVPADGWADTLVRAHEEQGVVAVGGSVDRRDGRAVDLALSFCEYGRFFASGRPGPARDLPGINVAYDTQRVREVFGAIPEEVVECDLHPRLLDRGERFWREPAAVIFDESTLPLGVALRSQFHHGRLFGGRRLAGRSFASRLLRFALSPLVPAVLFSRIARAVTAAGRGADLVRAGGPLGLLLLAWAVGEAVGSIAGEGRSGTRWT